MIRLAEILALAALALVVLPTGPAAAKDDPEKIKKDRDAVREMIVEKKGGFPFNDLRYYVDMKKIDDSRWSHEGLANKDIRNGPQIRCQWSIASSAGGGLGIEVVVFKLLHKDEVKNVEYSMPFKHWGESVKCSDVNKILEGFYEDWRREATDVVEDACQKPKKKKIGPAKIWAAVVATNPETKEREYRAWYAWGHGKDQATYLCRVRVGQTFLDKEGIVDKGEEFVKNIKEIKDKRVK